MKNNIFFLNTRTEKHFPVHNIQQASDAIDALEESNKKLSDGVGSLPAEIESLKAQVSQLQADLEEEKKRK